MTTAEQISQIAATLPEPLAKEALDFICFLQAREHGEFAECRKPRLLHWPTFGTTLTTRCGMTFRSGDITDLSNRRLQ